MNIKIVKEEMFFMENGKRVFKGQKVISFLCPQCNAIMNFFRVFQDTDKIFYLGYECGKCGYQEDVNLNKLED